MGRRREPVQEGTDVCHRSQEQAKREIFARYASFIYLGNGRYGYAAASEYYFGKTLSSYSPDDAGNAALLAAISKSPRDSVVVLGNANAAILAEAGGRQVFRDRETDVSGDGLYEAARGAREIRSAALRAIQEGLRGVVRLPNGTAHSLDARDFPIPVMGKTGTTSDFRDALFVGSTYGTLGITVAVRIGFDDNRPLGEQETGGRTALPIFREIMLRVYQDQLVGRAPHFPREIEDGIDQYLATPIVVAGKRLITTTTAALPACVSSQDSM